MGLGDKIEHTAEELAGKAKRGAGKAMDDEELEARGILEEEKAKRERAIDEAAEAADRIDDDLDEGR